MPPSSQNAPAPGQPPARDMAWIPGGTFRMGSEDFYPEERPVHEVTVDGFWMDDHPVTVAEFRRFVKATGHVTLAEQPPEPADYPDADPALLVPGSLVFHRTRGPVDLDDYTNWWSWVPGAQWRHPEGPESTLDGRERHRSPMSRTTTPGPTPPGPARSSPRRRSGSSRPAAGSTAPPTPGVTSSPRRVVRWPTPGRASSPGRTCCSTGTSGTSPIRSYPGQRLRPVRRHRQRLGVDDRLLHPDAPRRGHPRLLRPSGPRLNPRVTSPDASFNVGQPGEQFPRMVIKGGSHLCAPNYCHRYRPAARSPQSDRDLDGPPGLSLHRPGRLSRATWRASAGLERLMALNSV